MGKATGSNPNTPGLLRTPFRKRVRSLPPCSTYGQYSSLRANCNGIAAHYLYIPIIAPVCRRRYVFENPHMKPMSSTAPHAAVLQAGRHQFRPGQRLGSPCVRSRFLFRCLAGRGVLTVNVREYAVSAGDFLFLPWGRSIAYRADRQEPMAISGTHIVPDYRPGPKGFLFGIPHADSDPQAFSPARRDAHLGELEGVVRGVTPPRSALNDLADYIVNWYFRGECTEWQSRALAQLLLHELYTATARSGRGGAALPPELQLLNAELRRNFAGVHTVESLSSHVRCSPATLNRLFRRHLGVTPAAWVHQQRMQHAGYLLSSTSLSIAAVGREVGLADPCHFSKSFRAWAGQTAREYRSRMRLV
ncbi:MAG: helix-turn-helix domain-containing protein [Chitinivibrionales bacterium]|nr:helix-turn-helix domain-containing protein [Chitinivibrionales bacterium]